MTAALDTILSEAARAGEIPGVVAMVANRDGLLYEGGFGTRRLGADAPMTPDTVAWIASMTKAITTVALLQLVEEGRVDLDAPASTYAPEIGDAALLHDFDAEGRPLTRTPARPVTVRHLLTHTAGYTYDFASSALRKYMKATGLPATNTGRLASLGAPLVGEPGEAFIYGISTDWAGRIVEIVTGKPLETVFRERIFAPLGMTDTMFRLGADQMARRATVHGVTEDGTYVPTEMVVVQEPEFASGGGGLYATAGDYLTFLRMILAGGSLGGERILGAESIAGLMTDQIPQLSVPALGLMSPMGLRSADFFRGKPTGWTLGFQQNREQTPEGRPAGALSWAGFANTFYWIDPKNGLAGVFITQIVPFFDPRAIRVFRAFETEVYRGR
ncbi:MAG: serine hydrolase domain-containing protein [Phreatobacter sp.]|uniref:serine hydrolase domain-containing protein n=1 Tax=Phreatobacter sp. TaxID=1966341 RepID=UPI0040371CDC